MTYPQPIQRELFPGRERVPAPRAERVAPPAERLLRALRRRWLVALVAFVLTVVSVCAAVALLPPQYQAQASVEFSTPPELLHSTDPDPLAVSNADDLHTLEWQFSSRASALATVEALHLDRVARLKPLTPQDAADQLLRRFELDPVEQSRVLVLRYRDRDPARAALVVNTLVTVTLRRLQQQRLHGLEQARATLARQWEDAQQALLTSQQQLHAFAAAVPDVLTGSGDEVSAAADRLRALEAARTQADIQAAHQQAVLQSTGNGASNGAAPLLPASLGTDLSTQLLLRRADVEARIRRLSAQYVPGALPLVQARQELDSIDASLRRYRAAGVQREREQWKARQREQSRLAAAIQHQQQVVAAQQQARLHYADLLRESAAAARLCDQLEARRQQLAVEASWSPSPARLVDAATPPVAPARPRLALAAILALAAAGVVAPAAAFLRDHADGALHLPEAAELGVPLLTSIAQPGGTVSLVAKDIDPVLVAIRAAARQYGSCVFLLAGPRDGEGKSAVAAHLAQSLAETGDPVLVIDANFRRPRLHQHVGLETGAAGLAEFLVGQHSLDETVHSVCLPGRSGNWSLLPAGTASLTPSQLLLLPAMQDLLNGVRRQYQWVFIASGAVLDGVEMRLLLELCDAGILVLSVHGRSRVCARAAMHRLRGWKAPVLGLIRLEGNGHPAEQRRA